MGANPRRRGVVHAAIVPSGCIPGRVARQAYLVKCDAETTTQDDINAGIVNVFVGFAPLKPAEFVIISLQLLAGQAQA